MFRKVETQLSFYYFDFINVLNYKDISLFKKSKKIVLPYLKVTGYLPRRKDYK